MNNANHPSAGLTDPVIHRKQENIYKDIFDNVAIGMHWVNSEGIIIWANQTEMNLLGYTTDEYIGHHISEFHADKNVIDDILTRLSGKQTLNLYEAGLRCKDGSVRHVIINSNVLWEEDKFIHTRCFTIDVTEQKKAKEKFLESENRYKQFIDGLPAAFYTCNAEGFIESFNESAIELWGRVPELGKDMWCGSGKIFKTDGTPLPLNECPMAIALNEGRIVSFEIIIERPDGSKCHVLPHPKLIYDSRGKITGAINTLIDITVQVSARKKAEESEHRLSSLISQVGAGIAQADTQGNFFEVNERFCTITGYSRKELLTMKPSDLTHPDALERTAELMKQAIAENEGFFIEKKYIKKDGSIIWVNLNIALLTATGGEKYFAAVCIDITKDKEQELKIQELLLNEQNARKAMYELFMQAPAAICILRGPKHIYELANEKYLQIIGNRVVLGKTIRQALPELEGSGMLGLLDEVYNTGKPFVGNEVPVMLERVPGKLEECIFNFVYQPSFDAQGAIDGILCHGIEVTEQVLARKKIEESEMQFSTLANNVQNLAWMANADGWIYWYNNRWYEYTGTLPEDMEGWGWQSVHDPETLPVVLKRWKLSIDTGNPFEMIFPIKAADGSFRNFLTRVFPIRDTDNKVVRWVGTNTDIQEQKKTEEQLEYKVKERTVQLENLYGQLEKKTSQLEEAQQLARIGSWEWDVPANKIVWSDELFRIYGLDPNEFEPTFENFLGYIHPEDREFLIDIVKKSLIDHKPYLLTHRIITPEGIVRTISSTGKVFTDANNMPARLAGTAQDVTEQKKYEAELKKSEERYHRMINEVEDYAILYLNKDGFIENWNKGAEKIKGYKAEEIIGKHFSIFYSEEDLQVSLPYKLLETASKEGKSSHEGWRVRKDRSVFWGNTIITTLQDEHHDIIGFSKVTRDLTARKLADDKIKKDAAQLQEKNEQLERMNKELEAFAYVSSHDLQEPLRKIQTFANRLLEKEDQNLSETGKHYFNRMQDAAARMQKLIEDLLAYSRASNVEQNFENTDLSQIVEEVKAELKETIEEKNATIETTEMCYAKIIPFQFRQLMNNLLGNALKFSKPETAPHITIKSHLVKYNTPILADIVPGKEYCHINITDNGIGFEKEYSKKIFEVFQRLHGKAEYEGTGIGLSIVKKIVENHYGIISATSELNKGASFDIYLPVTQ